MVPATSASSTIDSRLSLSPSVSSVSAGIIAIILRVGARCASKTLLRLDELTEYGPARRFLCKGFSVGRARRWKVYQRQARRRVAHQLAADARRCGSVEGDGLKLRKIVKQMLDLVVFRLADRLIEAARPIGGRNHVPKPDPAVGQAAKAILVSESLQLFPNRSPKEAPELVRRVRVITLRRQRCVARQAA